MKSIIRVFTCISSLCLISACAPTAATKISRQNNPVTINGEANEWQIPLRFYDNSTKLNYALSNDDEKLYVCIRVVDELSQAKVMQSGLQLWLDTTGKKNKQIGILFPVPSSKDAGGYANHSGSHHGGKRHGGGDMSDTKREFISEANQMRLSGFKPGIGEYLSPNNEFGISININWDANNIMIYEAAIPFSAFYKPSLDPKDSLKAIGFSIAVNGLLAPEKKEEDNQSGPGNGGMGGGGGMGGMGGGMNGMGGGMGGSGMGGGGMGGGRGGRSGGGAPEDPRYQTNSFWTKIHLATK